LALCSGEPSTIPDFIEFERSVAYGDTL
jgi:hypothetical protein